MKRFFVLFGVIVLTCFGCQNKSFDFATIKLGDNIINYKLNESDFFDKVSLPVDSVQEYVIALNERFYFDKILIDTSSVSRLRTLNDKIATYYILIDKDKTLSFAKELILKFDKPTAIIHDSIHINPKINVSTINEFREEFPTETGWREGKDDEFYYPSLFFWEDVEFYHYYAISIDSDGEVSNRYTAITKEALISNKIYGFRYPVPSESLLYKYIK